MRSSKKMYRVMHYHSIAVVAKDQKQTRLSPSYVRRKSEKALCQTHPETTMASSVELEPIESALECFRNGEFLLVVDDMDRENEGDLVIAASKISTQQMAFLIKHSRSDRALVILMIPD